MGLARSSKWLYNAEAIRRSGKMRFSQKQRGKKDFLEGFGNILNHVSHPYTGITMLSCSDNRSICES